MKEDPPSARESDNDYFCQIWLTWVIGNSEGLENIMGRLGNKLKNGQIVLRELV